MDFERLTPDPAVGLSSEQAQRRMDCGAHNAPPEGITPSVGNIVFKNVFTLFNFINLLLALAVTLVGHPKNALFFFIAVGNTLMGIVQELRAKRTLDRLSVLARGKATVIRDGRQLTVDQDEVVLDDVLLVAAGGQICADGELLTGEGLEVNESLLTGEADNIAKHPGDRVLSGSFAAAGQGRIHVTAVGRDSYAGTLTVAARREKKNKTPLKRTLDNIIRALTIAILPLGALLFYTQYTGSGELVTSVLGTTAAMIGMIPEGLILLTGVTLTVGALKLASKKALVQSLPSIETLARVDVLCLDKTGTITDGTLEFEELIALGGTTAEQAGELTAALMGALSDDNATATALRAAFSLSPLWPVSARVPFSSARKWSAAGFEGHGCCVLGAPGFVLDADALELIRPTIDEYAARGLRVLCLAKSNGPLPEDGLPDDLQAAALLILSDTIRPEAADTFRFFSGQGVTLKVISGDDALTVSTIARRAGIEGAERYVDMSALPEGSDLAAVARENTVFGRVTPEQKRALIAALKDAGHTVCMTGDGVNDVLAMKEADCSVAMIGGSDAARGACDFVLMSSNFAAMVDVLREGRRVINNIENVASMYLVKTIYSTLLSLLYIFIPSPYPFAPLQMTPISALTVGVPSFFLALRGNYEKPQGRFLANVLENSLPAALVVVFNVLVVELAGASFGLTQAETSTMNVLLTGLVGFCLLIQVARPLKPLDIALISALAVVFSLTFLLFGDFFMLGSLFTRNAFFYLPLCYISHRMFLFLSRRIARAARIIEDRRRARMG
ncbi:HAD-IC family P-type ATPase [Clostridiales bacterium BX7]|uniref:HAD-IC family P-type ATPase n=2 Tax=Feifania hominis TaxID=2763660 RepID=A0A926DFJ8_9FIRM|nr:HAD-IC family P-type ATPase [Feifania hominis]